MTCEIESPLISVMMPAYNVEAYLSAALDSLMNQTYSNWEAIVVDDGSTDGTKAILEAYAAKDDRIRPFYSSHGGRGVARNTALQHCKGEFIAMLDADDVTTPDRFEKQLDFLQKNQDYDVVSGQCVSFNGDPYADPRKRMPWPTDSNVIRQNLVNGRMKILNGAAMIRRIVFDKYGGYRPELVRAQDYEFFRRLAIAGVTMGALEDIVLLYRQHTAIPTASYYLDSESYKHYANALHSGYQKSYREFQASAKGLLLYMMTALRYGYLFLKLSIRYRGFR